MTGLTALNESSLRVHIKQRSTRYACLHIEHISSAAASASVAAGGSGVFAKKWRELFSFEVLLCLRDLCIIRMTCGGACCQNAWIVLAEQHL